MPVKRLRYFRYQFLQENDFKDEQDYHKTMRYRHNKWLHTCGIVDGLTVYNPVVNANGNVNIEIKSGWAFDKEGKEIIVEEDIKDLDLTELTNEFNQSLTKGIYLTIAQSEEPTDPNYQKDVLEGESTCTRTTESFLLKVYSTSDIWDRSIDLILAKITLNLNGTFDIDDSEVKKAGAMTGESSFDGIRFSVEGHEGDEWPELKGLEIGDPGTGLQGIQVNSEQTNFSGNVEINEKLKVGKGFEGKVEIINSKGSALFCRGIEKEDGLQHGVLGILSYNLQQNYTYHTAAIVGISQVSNIYGVYTFAPNNTYALYVNGKSCFKSDIGETGERVPNLYADTIFTNNIGDTDKKVKNLYVENLVTDTINGNLYPSGHFVDKFINASGQILKTGDVVKLKGTPVNHFQGYNNRIPVAEVCLADKENDILLIGIVSCGEIRESDISDTEAEPDDFPSIEDGEELFVVTLGAFAWCKADATDAPIEAGDLLTSSSNPGYAKKATDPQIGSIIGKALEPLKEGTGHIAIFVNLQ